MAGIDFEAVGMGTPRPSSPVTLVIRQLGRPSRLRKRYVILLIVLVTLSGLTYLDKRHPVSFSGFLQSTTNY